MTKGAQPSDRVMRFLDAARVAKREKRNNPQKAIPRKERKAQAEAAKAAAGAVPPPAPRQPLRGADLDGRRAGLSWTNRRRARRARRSSAPLVRVRSGGDRALRSARNRRRAGVRDRSAAPGQGSFRRAAVRHSRSRCGERADQCEALRAARAVAADAEPRRVLSRRSDRPCGRRPRWKDSRHRCGDPQFRCRRPDRGAAARTSSNAELVHFDTAHVPEVDITSGRIVVHPPDGLFKAN